MRRDTALPVHATGVQGASLSQWSYEEASDIGGILRVDPQTVDHLPFFEKCPL
jgi:hypothetical protein